MIKADVIGPGIAGSGMFNLSILLALWLALLPPGASSAASPELETEFNHDDTGFPLEFRHVTVRCEACHVQGIFAGTPRRCAECHSYAGRIQASAQSSRHIPVIPDCEACHTASAWETVIVVDHAAVIGNCQYCHNGVTATGKHPEHLQTGDVCDDCHSTVNWTGALFDHGSVSGECITCHNGVIAEGKDPGHIQTAVTCGDCHNTFGWLPVLRVDHGAVLGSCFSCHDGVTATGKHPQHIVSSNDCELCHNTLAWIPAN
jgi:hypothetical protein